MMFTERRLIENISVNGRDTPVNTDFRLMCRMYEGENVLAAFYLAGLPEGADLQSAVNAMMDFYLDGIAPERDRERGDKPHALPVFDFKEDEGLFYAAFLAAYGIDLNKAQMHWFDFCALFKGLPDDCRLKQVIGVRSTKMSDVPKYDRKRMQHLKQVYALKKNRPRKFASKQEYDADMKARIERRYAEVQARARGEMK